MASAEYHRQWRATHLESTRAASRRCAARRRIEQPEQTAAISRRYWNSPKGVMRLYTTNAKRRGFEFDLDVRLVGDLISDCCFYCGTEPHPRNGIDRVDNTRGYYEDNVVSCCRECNRVKRHHTADYMIAWTRRVVARFPEGVALWQ